jgi:hypothetical protein
MGDGEGGVAGVGRGGVVSGLREEEVELFV